MFGGSGIAGQTHQFQNLTGDDEALCEEIRKRSLKSASNNGDGRVWLEVDGKVIPLTYCVYEEFFIHERQPSEEDLKQALTLEFIAQGNLC